MLPSCGVCRIQSLAGQRSRFKAIDSAPFLQYVSGPSSNCLASIIGVGTPLILRNKQFFLHHFSLLLLYKFPRTIFSLTVETHFVACLLRLRRPEFDSQLLFLKLHVSGGRKIPIVFKSSHLFSSFLLSRLKVRGVQLVSQRKTLKIHQHFTTLKLNTFSKCDKACIVRCQTDNIT
jgi:hypothetical protein